MRKREEQLGKLTTEGRNPCTDRLDDWDALAIVSAMNNEDKKVAEAVEEQLTVIAQAVDLIVRARTRGGRLIYVGAGTSGRLGLLDAVECPPTFGTEPEEVVGLIAGGPEAFIAAVEGAEDSENAGVEDLEKIKVGPDDIVVGLAASGRTPYVMGALRHARASGAATVAVSCNDNSRVSTQADIAIEIMTGPEVLTGSTRLKAGTAQKMVCNMLSTAAMVMTGKVYRNLMVDVRPTNEKLVDRAHRIVQEATGVSYEEAAQALVRGGNAKVAIVMLLGNCSADEARRVMEDVKGHVGKALEALR